MKSQYRAVKNCEGKGTLGCLLSLVLLAAGTYVGMQVGPPYFAYKSLQADVGTEVSRAGAHFFNDEVLVQNVIDVARKNEIPLKKEDIKVERFAGKVSVSIHYSVPVDLVFTRHTFNFEIKASSFIGTL
jgi:hypothetical protein